MVDTKLNEQGMKVKLDFDCSQCGQRTEQWMSGAMYMRYTNGIIDLSIKCKKCGRMVKVERQII